MRRLVVYFILVGFFGSLYWTTPLKAAPKNIFLPNLPASSNAAPPSGYWTPSAPMHYRRAWHSATLLGDGRVLVAGGEDGDYLIYPSELYDPSSDSWTIASNLNHPRTRHSATMLDDGRVLIAGGRSGMVLLVSSEIYDPTTGAWELVDVMNHWRVDHSATLLADGRVLVSGEGSAETFDPVTEGWSQVADPLVARRGPASILLDDGQVLVVGGADPLSGIELASAEIYDPLTDKWTATTSMQHGRVRPDIARLPDGRILVVGGFHNDPQISASAEVYDPLNKTWSATDSLNLGRVDFSLAALDGGLVLAAGGDADNLPTSSAEIYHPQTNSWSLTGALLAERYGHTLTRLADGRLLAAGGEAYESTTAAPAGITRRGLNSDDLYTPVTPEQSLWVTTNADVYDLPAPCASAVLSDLPGSDGKTSLREALCVANNAAPGAMPVIGFAILSGHQVINPTLALPDITHPLVLDASSQPGFSGAPLIELRGNGLNAPGLNVQAGESILRGLVINSFSQTGVILQTNGENALWGNRIGIDYLASQGLPNGKIGVAILDSPGNILGGATPLTGNRISAQAAAVYILGASASGNYLAGNLLGRWQGDPASLTNTTAVWIENAPSNVIGGMAEGERNQISGNALNGVIISGTLASNNSVINNRLEDNGFAGVAIYDSPSAVIEQNQFYENHYGVIVSGASAVGNQLAPNSFRDNVSIGIDLSPPGPTPNDPLDADDGPNHLQNYPTIELAFSPRAGGFTTVWGSLHSAPFTQYVIYLFRTPVCHPSGYGEGLAALPGPILNTGADGYAAFIEELPVRLPPGSSVTALAVALDGSTSEFSPCKVVVTPTAWLPLVQR